MSRTDILQIMNEVRMLGWNIATLPAIAAIRFGDRIAIHDDFGSISYRALNERIVSIAASLSHRYSFGAGKSLGIMCRNHRGYLEILFAGFRLGVEIVLIDPDFLGLQLVQVLLQYDCAIIVHDEEFTELIRDAGYKGETILSRREFMWNYTTLDHLAINSLDSINQPLPYRNLVFFESTLSINPKTIQYERNFIVFIQLFCTAYHALPFLNQSALIGSSLCKNAELTAAIFSFIRGLPIILERHFYISAQPQLEIIS